MLLSRVGFSNLVWQMDNSIAKSDAAHPPISYRKELGDLLRLGSPLIINNLALAGMGFADAAMAGRLGAIELAAVAVGHSVWMLFFLSALGLLMAISPISARHIGRGSGELIGRYTRQGFWLSIGLSVVTVIAIFYGSAPALTAIGIDESFRALTVDYLRAIVWGAPAIFAFLVLRFTTEGVSWTRPVMYVSLSALVVNVLGNYMFIYGRFGAPEMGAEGCGVASAITMWFSFFALLIYMLASKRYTPFNIFSWGRGPRGKEMGEILRLGSPIMVSVLAEVGLFSGVSLLMGTLSANIAAAHQIALNYASVMFMVPMALNSAVTVLVGRSMGEGNLPLARIRGFIGIATCAVFMLASSVILIVFRDQIVGIYTRDAAVHSIAMSLLFVAAIFQISDGIQVGAAGALRGVHDTRVPMFLTTFSYWVVAFPLTYIAAIQLRLSPAMIWGGFVVGLSIAAVLLVTRFNWISKRPEYLPALVRAG